MNEDAWLLRVRVEDWRRVTANAVGADGLLVLGPNERAKIGASASSAIAVFELGGIGTARDPYALSTSADGTALFVHRSDERMTRQLAVGDTLDVPFEGTPVLRFEVLRAPATPPSDEAGPRRLLARGVVREAKQLIRSTITFDKDRTYALVVRADGALDVFAEASESGPEQPCASARIAAVDAERLLYAIEPEKLPNLAPFGSTIGRGASELSVSCGTVDGRPSSATFAFDCKPVDRNTPERWTVAASGRTIAIVVSTLFRLVFEGLPKPGLDAWRKLLPRLSVPIVKDGAHGRLLLRYNQFNAHDANGGSHRTWLKLWEDGTLEIRADCRNADDDGVVSDAANETLDVALVKSIHERVPLAEMGEEYGLGPSVFRFVWYGRAGEERRFGVSYEVDHGARFGSVLSDVASDLVSDLASLFRRHAVYARAR